MMLDDIKAFVAPELAQNLAQVYAEFCQQTGLDDLDLFIEYLRYKNLLDTASIGKLYAQDEIELSSLDLFGTTYPAQNIPDPELQALLKQVFQPSREHYQVIGQVGAGAMGFIHLARDQDLQRKVALKTIKDKLAVDLSVKRQFLSEVQITAQLEHPNIVPIYSLEVQPSGALGYSMKLVQGKTLKDLIKAARQRVLAGQPLEREHDLPTLLEHFLKVCDAMSYAHHKGVIHRDLKPANIMVGMFNEIYVMDWGIAKIMRQHPAQSGQNDPENADFRQLIDALNVPAASKRTLAGEIVGTPRYMSPQQAAGKSEELDDKSDQFALGLILFEIVCLKPAFQSGKLLDLLVKVLKAEKEPLEHLSPKIRIPRELKAMIHKATAKKTPARYPSVKALADDLRAYLQGKSVSAEPDTRLQALVRWMGHHRQATFTALLGFLLLCCLATIGSLYSRQHTLRETQQREAYLSQFLLQVSQQKQALENQLLSYETLLAGLTASAQTTLQTRPTQQQLSSEPVYFAQDYAQHGPPDLRPSRHYQQELSLDWPVFKLAPGLEPATALPTAQKMSQIRHYFKSMFITKMRDADAAFQPQDYATTLLNSGAPLVWAYVALESGLHMAYPGRGGYAPDYDPRLRPWYAPALQAPEPQWGTPYLDAGGQGMLLACSHAIRDQDGRVLGVAGLDVPLTVLMQNLLAASAAASEQQLDVKNVSLVNLAGEVILERSSLLDPERTPFPLITYPFPEVIQALKTQSSGYLQLGQRLIAYQRLNVLDGYYIVETDRVSPRRSDK